MTNTTYPQVWDLDVFFPGGSASPELKEHIQNLTPKFEELKEKVTNLQVPISVEVAGDIVSIIENIKDTMMNISQAGAVLSCLTAQDTTDREALLLQGQLSGIAANFSPILESFNQKIGQIDQAIFEALLETEELAQFAFILTEWREKSKESLSEDEEALISALGVDGYSSWGQLYSMLIGDIKVEVEVDGEKKLLSVGQANNLSSHKDRTVRKAAFDALEKVFTEREEFFAKTLNHLAGFRLAVYKKRGWESVTKEPLQINRMKQETIDAMWGAITSRKATFADYLTHKAKMLGTDKLDWFDFDAPVTDSTATMDYQQGAEFILKHFGRFGSEMESFARTAFEDGWIEAEDRDNKRPGGFCTSMPLSQQSRIFMTYSGTMSNVSTLAHELGHAFHTYALRPVHPLNTRYAMNVAETASTFAEMIVADAAVEEATNEQEKIALLEDKIQRSVAFFMNIHARYLFETRFYEERKNGVVSTKRINEIMEQAQVEAHAGGLGETHPHFWASKMHFYITGVPFYNFPYTFGYLFSLSIYAKAKEEGLGFEEKYMALLRDTAVMTVEDLAMKHLGEDITKQDFWLKGIALCEKDVEEFIALTSK
ncbi:oligoendopeptidase [Lysinibacillus sp. 2017]|uniref:M3 family oligoendopeptidase n=1 Tax=unclassified Lysinibacillus TaxID=2636778 RepID=UPI000D5264B2|nr:MULTISPECIES: M3 family oligoendopeptidase [unclassified Lysinibacillus]AWE07422.1 oligoendopeptidase [Lysinibacillus sp. 2017]TGN36586.1 M3 family oligoendopeptidase [Lysinibacillus sp. S2017]